MAVVTIIGGQWGDEGKGKIIDLLAPQIQIAVRCQGGHDTAHVVVYRGVTYHLHLIPAAIFNPQTSCLLGHGMVIDPEVLIDEMKLLGDSGIDLSRLHISERAHVIMPYHQREDELAIAFNLREVPHDQWGIGPAYVDKAAGQGIRMCDLLNEEVLLSKLSVILVQKNELFHKIYGAPPLSLHEIYLKYLSYGRQLYSQIIEMQRMVYKAVSMQQNIMLEGGQGCLLDIDFGVYPHVVSYSATASGIAAGSGLPPQAVDTVLGVFRAYSIRDDSGPLPSEIHEVEIINQIFKGGYQRGHDAQPRRCGWFDAVAAKFAVMVNGITRLAITQLDALDDLESVKICTAYQYNDIILHHMPGDATTLENVRPIFEVHPGWRTPTTQIHTYEDLPDNAKYYIERVRQLLGPRLDIVSVGSTREQTIFLHDIIPAGRRVR